MKIDVGEYLEVTLCLILLTICTVIGVGETMSSYQRIRYYEYENYSDKNVQDRQGVYDSTDYLVDYMTLQEVILTVESQDYNMPETKWLAACDGDTMLTSVELIDKYRDTLIEYSRVLSDAVVGNSNMFQLTIYPEGKFLEKYGVYLTDEPVFVFSVVE